jgi:hypothetical protein
LKLAEGFEEADFHGQRVPDGGSEMLSQIVHGVHAAVEVIEINLFGG